MNLVRPTCPNSWISESGSPLTRRFDLWLDESRENPKTRVGIYKRKQESKEKERKHALDQESDQKKRSRKKESFVLFFLEAFLVESVFSFFFSFLIAFLVESGFFLFLLWIPTSEQVNRLQRFNWCNTYSPQTHTHTKSERKREREREREREMWTLPWYCMLSLVLEKMIRVLMELLQHNYGQVIFYIYSLGFEMGMP